MVDIDLKDFKKFLIDLMKENFGSVEEAVKKCMEFQFTIRDKATSYLLKTYSKNMNPKELQKFMQEIPNIYGKTVNEIISEYR